jgi:membrane protease YdiL (CAAX protease family)
VSLLVGRATVSELFSGVAGANALPFAVAFGVYAIQFLSVAVWEELISRGLALTSAVEGLRNRWLSDRGAVVAGVVASALIFSITHFPNSLAAFGSRLLMGVILGAAYVWTDSLALPMGLHFLVNFATNNVYGLANVREAAEVPPVLIRPTFTGPSRFVGVFGILNTGAWLCVAAPLPDTSPSGRWRRVAADVGIPTARLIRTTRRRGEQPARQGLPVSACTRRHGPLAPQWRPEALATLPGGSDASPAATMDDEYDPSRQLQTPLRPPSRDSTARPLLGRCASALATPASSSGVATSTPSRSSGRSRSPRPARTDPSRTLETATERSPAAPDGVRPAGEPAAAYRARIPQGPVPLDSIEPGRAAGRLRLGVRRFQSVILRIVRVECGHGQRQRAEHGGGNVKRIQTQRTDRAHVGTRTRERDRHH